LDQTYSNINRSEEKRTKKPVKNCFGATALSLL